MRTRITNQRTLFSISIVFLVFAVHLTVSAQVALNEIDYHQDLVEIKNLGGNAVDISSWWLCSRFFYQPISSLTVLSGSTNLSPDGIVVLAGFPLDDTSADLGLYIDINNNFGNFGNPAFMASFVQWGAGNIGRASVAVNAGIWSDGADFVPTVANGRSIEYKGVGASAGAWFDQANPTLGDDNSLPVELSQFTAKRTSEGVLVKWGTETETNNLGFNLYRVEGENVVKVNVVLIRGHGTTGASHKYQFLDLDAPEGDVGYFLEDIDFSGNREPSHIIGVSSPKERQLITWGQIKASHRK